MKALELIRIQQSYQEKYHQLAACQHAVDVLSTDDPIDTMLIEQLMNKSACLIAQMRDMLAVIKSTLSTQNERL